MNKLSDCIKQLAINTKTKEALSNSARMDRFKTHIQFFLERSAKDNSKRPYNINYGAIMYESLLHTRSDGLVFFPTEDELLQLIEWLKEEGFQVKRNLANINVDF